MEAGVIYHGNQINPCRCPEGKARFLHAGIRQGHDRPYVHCGLRRRPGLA